MLKILGYVLLILGIVLIVLKLAFKNILEKIPFLSGLDLIRTIIIALVLIVIGFLFLKGKKQAEEEVPIYHGKRIVGYRKK